MNTRVSPGFPISAISHPLIRPSQQGVLSRRAGVFKRAERGGGGCHADRKRVSVGVVFIQFHSDNSAAQFATYFTVSPLCRDLWPEALFGEVLLSFRGRAPRGVAAAGGRDSSTPCDDLTPRCQNRCR